MLWRTDKLAGVARPGAGADASAGDEESGSTPTIKKSEKRSSSLKGMVKSAFGHAYDVMHAAANRQFDSLEWGFALEVGEDPSFVVPEGQLLSKPRRYEFLTRLREEATQWVRVFRLLLAMRRVGLPLKQVNPYDFESYLRLRRARKRGLAPGGKKGSESARKLNQAVYQTTPMQRTITSNKDQEDSS